VAGASSDSPGLKFVQSGHWIYNSTLGTVFHIDGGTKNVDSQASVPGAGPGTQVVQTDKSGFVLAEGKTIEFGKSDLSVADPLLAPTDERPIGLEAAGVAYAIYPQSGRIARFGDNSLVQTAGRLGPPAVTSAGTLWVHRLDTGQLCQLPVKADRLSCPAKVPLGHAGALTMVGDQATFVDLTAGQMQAVDEDGLGRSISLAGLNLPADSILAANDVAGRVAILDPGKNLLHLIDTAQLTGDKQAADPIVKKLRPGKYERIASSGAGIALIDENSATLITLDRNGDQREVHKIPAPSKASKAKPTDRAGLFRGADSRLYVDSAAGEHVLVVEEGGEVTGVDTNQPKPTEGKTTEAPGNEPTSPVTTLPPTTIPTTTPPSTSPSVPHTVVPTGKPTNRPPVVQPSKPGNRPTRTEQPPTQPPEPTHQPTTHKPTPKPPPKTTPKPPPPPTVSASKPGAPRSVSGKAGESRATVSWGAAASNGADITKYTVSWSGGSRTASAGSRSMTITGLTNGTGYTFTVRATNRVGAGPGASTSRIVPTGGPPDAPPGFSAQPGSGKATLTWGQPNLHGGTLVRYEYTYAGPEGQGGANGTSRSHTFRNLYKGDYYMFTVRAVTKTSDGRELTGPTSSTFAEIGGGSGAPAFLFPTSPVSYAEPHVWFPQLWARPLVSQVIR
jgi:hypothetical protein